MKLTAKVKLQPNSQQMQALNDTLIAVNQACDYISEQAWQAKTFGKFNLQKVVYHDVRSQFSLSAQMTIRAIAKVSDAYKLDKKMKRTFKSLGGIAYDNRILSWKIDQQEVSILTLEGRVKLPFVCGERQKVLLANQQGESDLCLIDNNFYLFTTCAINEPALDDVTEFLGVDLGIKAIAVDSDGEIFSGTHINNIRARYAELRGKLQAKGTSAAKHLLKKRRKKETLFSQHTNHVISKHLVDKAKDTGRGIALEDLKGINARITVRKGQRRVHHSWAFHDLSQKIKYKAALVGVPVVLIDPRNTSRECAICGYTAKANRPNQEVFLCKSCGHSALADLNAACVIACRAVVSQPVL